MPGNECMQPTAPSAARCMCVSVSELDHDLYLIHMDPASSPFCDCIGAISSSVIKQPSQPLPLPSSPSICFALQPFPVSASTPFRTTQYRLDPCRSLSLSCSSTTITSDTRAAIHPSNPWRNPVHGWHPAPSSPPALPIAHPGCPTHNVQ